MKNASPPHLRQFSSAKAKAEASHRNGSDGFRTNRLLSEAVDGLLKAAFAALPRAVAKPYAIVALGGYGRKELCFGSDVDIMVLSPGSPDEPQHTSAINQVMHAFLDLPLDLGHSARTVQDCVDLLEPDFEAWISLLDSRFLCGNRGLYAAYLRALRASLRSHSRSDILERLLTLSRDRHAKYGRTTKLLEPNIKNSSGGLRDLHTVLWILKVILKVPIGRGPSEPALRSLFRSDVLLQLFPRPFLRDVRAGTKALLHVRNEMHRSTASLHDTLEFASQTSIASALGYRSGNVERFMRDYYDAAYGVAELHARVMLWAQDKWVRRASRVRGYVVHGALRSHAGRIGLRAHTRPTTEIFLKAFLLRAELQAEFSFSLEDAIHRTLPRLRAIHSGPEAELLRHLFARTGRTASSLRAMNRLGVLARWIPEWRPLVRFFQHNQYHFYTADEHTLRVIESAESLEHDTTPFGDAYRSLPRHETLFFACLFHDITKPQRLDDHEHSGAELAEKVLDRLGANDIAPDVAFLVRNHLIMEQIAFRRNLSDPTTIRDFARHFARPELLDYLFVLTYADLSAVNTNVLTDWKKSLLTELYQKTSAHLRPGTKVPRPEVVMSDLVRTVPKDQLTHHASLLSDDAYLRSFSQDEIAEHLRILGTLSTVASTVQHWSDVTELTLFARDAPFVLARSCGVLFANDLSIIDAQVFTRDDGIVIDKFRVVDHTTNAPLAAERCRLVQHDLEEVFESRLTVESLLEGHRRRWKRRAMHLNPNARTDVVFESHPSYTIVDVFGVDLPGFLYHVTDTFSRLGCSIHAAKIATRGDGIVDAFYVRDVSGTLLDTPERRNAVRSAILDRINELYAAHIAPEHTR